MDPRIIENAKKMQQPKYVNVSFPPDVYYELSDMATESKRAVSFIVRGIVMTYLDELGAAPED